MNNCLMKSWMAWTCLACSFTLILLCLSAKVLIKKVVCAQDESEQTAQDYSIVVSDPSPEATDPDEWKSFFEDHFGAVVSVSVALNNSEIMLLLEEKHFILQQIKLTNKCEENVKWRECEILAKARSGSCRDVLREAPEGGTAGTKAAGGGGGTADAAAFAAAAAAAGCSMDGMEPLESHPASGLCCMHLGRFCQNYLGAGLDTAYWWRRLRATEARIAGLARGPNPDDPDERYKAVRVYVIFDSEDSQRACLRAMSLGTVPAALDWGGSVEARYQWRNADGTANVLDVREAMEPTEIRWDMFQTTYLERLLSQTVATTLSFGIVACGFSFLVINKGNRATTSLIIVVLNALFPTLFKVPTRHWHVHWLGERGEGGGRAC